MMKRFVTVACLFLLLVPPAAAEEHRFSPNPNMAARIQWRTWSAVALKEAQEKDRLILLSISAVWCHWCHIMDETTYSNDDVITLLNRQFIPVRIDADLRPDIDIAYNQGGWPSTVVLTPQGEVVSGGNYVPPDSMMAWLKRIAAIYAEDRAGVLNRLAELRAEREIEQGRGSTLGSRPGRADLDAVERVLSNAFDSVNGGFGAKQKFPNPDAIGFLVSRYAKKKEAGTHRMIGTTLDRMAGGEIHDRLEGGFFRYAVRPDWSEPHYEKMLDVNAGLMSSYAEAAHALDSEKYLSVAVRILHYIEKKLYDPATGAFFGSQDADEHYYRLKDRGRAKPPLVDRTTYVDASSLMISGLVVLYQATGQQQYLDMAVRNADLILRTMDAGQDGVYHSLRGGKPALKGLLSDNALFGAALLDLYNCTGRKHYLKRASDLGRTILDQYYDPRQARFRAVREPLVPGPAAQAPSSGVHENLANFRALLFISRLLYYGEYPGWQEMRDAVLQSMSGEYLRFTPQAGTYGSVLLYAVDEPIQITIVAGGRGADSALTQINRMHIPERVVQVLTLADDADEIRRRRYAPEEAVYVCAGKRCSKPLREGPELQKIIRELVEKSDRE